MVFRVLNNKLYKVEIEIVNENEFIEKQNTKQTKFIKVDESQLPKIELPCNEIFYELDATGKIIIDEERTVSNCKKELLQKVNETFEKTARNLIKDYPEIEIQTWSKQEEEARAYLTDNTRQTPFLDKLSLERGIDKAVLAQKIVEKANLYANMIGILLGKKQKLKDLIEAISTVSDINNINIEATFENNFVEG